MKKLSKRNKIDLSKIKSTQFYVLERISDSELSVRTGAFFNGHQKTFKVVSGPFINTTYATNDLNSIKESRNPLSIQN